jgi:nucleotide-binding universal stress UspA family protein
MYRSILVPVDGSKLAERALSVAIPLAEQHGARLILLHVHEPMTVMHIVAAGVPLRDSGLDEKMRADARSYVDRLAKRTSRLTSAPVEGVFRDGPVIPTIVAYAAESETGLIVLSTHGRGGIQRLWLGSVADALLRQATVPVLLVRGARPVAKRLLGTPPFVRAVVPVDGSARSEEALSAVKALLGGVHARITLVHVLHPMSAVAGMNLKRDPEAEVVRDYLEPLAQRTASETLEVRHEAKIDAHVARVLLAAAETHDADLIAIAGQGLRGVQRMLVGSVADKLIRSAAVPVLVVPVHPG